MKLNPVYPDIVNRFQYVKTTNADAWQKYVKSVIAEHEYNGPVDPDYVGFTQVCVHFWYDLWVV